MWFTKRQQGAISVFLSIILLSTFLFSAVVVDGGRIYAARNIVSGAGQLALNAGLSNYDVALKDAYGLIAMSKTPEDLQENLHTYFVDSLGACGITEDDYNTALVFLQMAASGESFSSEGVDHTEICRGPVMEQQVLEYMKYRAPITVGTGILDKLKNGKEMEAAKEVADDELQTTKAANDVERELKKLKDLVDDEVKACKGFQAMYQSDLNKIEKLCREITVEELVACGYSQYRNEPVTAGDWEDDIKQFNTLSAKLTSDLQKPDKTDRYTAAYDTLLEMKGYYLTLKDVSKSKFMDFWKEKYKLNADSDSTESSGEEDAKNSEESKKIEKEGKLLYENYVSCKNYFLNVPSQISGQAKQDIKEVETISKRLYDTAESCRNHEEKVCKKIETIRKKLKKMKEKLDIWKVDTEALSIEELKANEKENQKEYEKLLSNDNGIGTMEDYAKKNQDFFEKFKKYMEKATFCNVALRRADSHKNSILQELDSHVGRASNGSTIKAFVASGDFYYLLPMAAPDGEFVHEPLRNLSDTEFYKYLEEVCGKKKNKDKVKDSNNKLNDRLKVFLEEMGRLFTTDDLEDVAYKLQEVQDALPTTMMGQGAENQDKKINSEETNIDNSDKREKSMDDALDSLNKDNTILSGITKLASKGTEAIIEPIYLTEYFMNMYSYYTIDKTGEKKSDGSWKTKDTKELVSLSDYHLTQDVIYRAEVEYILWGNKQDARTNVNNTKAVIFAIQFVGNLIYALTQSDVTKGAKEIGNLFGNPLVSVIVQVVVEVVVATVETVRDMVVLMNGGSVVMFKVMTPKKEWRSKLESITDIAGWDATKDKASSNKLAFSYKDYLWIMLCVKNLDETSRYQMLGRAADLAQVNVAKSADKKDYKLMDEYTMLKINANVELDSWLVTDIFNSSETGLDTSGKFTLKYKGIQGY
ncbi:MAG: DUF5702 domain-containing protein [Roseburia sp.]|nr:DUF5702 domain-containing protein [Roseburia sp.]MCM1278554.1 DUF5702 domain-containing protein [Robinsoniella sp.]